MQLKSCHLIGNLSYIRSFIHSKINTISQSYNLLINFGRKNILLFLIGNFLQVDLIHQSKEFAAESLIFDQGWLFGFF